MTQSSSFACTFDKASLSKIKKIYVCQEITQKKENNKGKQEKNFSVCV